MIEVTQCLDQGTKQYTLREQRPGRRGQYTWSYHTTFGELRDPIALDLLDIAKAIFLTDRAFPRSRWLGGQTRRLKVVIPVRKVRLWSGVRKLLESITRFVSADEWSIKFTKSTEGLFASRSIRKEINRNSVVALFSGGLDSLCGAAYLYRTNVRPVFVTHSPPGQERTRQLVFELADKLVKSELKNETQFASFRLFPIERNEAGVRTMFQDPSRRTRPFFFLSLAGAVAIDRGINRIQMSENGALAVNLPIRKDAYGARCARQAHAFVLRNFQLLLRTITKSAELSVVNPFTGMTKGEASKLLGPAQSIARKSVSCEYVGKQAATLRAWISRHRRRRVAIGSGPECGLCTPCLVRRAALKAAGIRDAKSWYFFDAGSVTFSEREKKQFRGVPLFSFISPNVYSMRQFSRRLTEISFRDFVVDYFPELRVTIGNVGEFSKQCKHIYDLEKRFGRELQIFLGD